jgi:tetratricopeptide (TPR) repeat protein
MFTKLIKASAGSVVLAALLSAVALAQTAQIEGTIKVKGEDGSMKTVPGALIDIYRLDINGHWDVKTDKNGHFIRLGLPVQGTFLFVVSGPGISPTWANKIKISQVPVLDLEATPGDGRTLTADEVNALKAGKSPGGGGGGGGAGKSAPQGSPQDKAKAEAADKEYQAKLKEGQALQENYNQARNHYNTGVELMHANNYQQALSEFEQAMSVDTSKHAAFSELAYKAGANAAEAHYQIGVDLFNKKNRDEAKPHFEQAVANINKAITQASAATPPEPNANINNDLIVYYNILTKNAQLLVEFYGAVALVDPTIQSIDKVETLDAANKNKWEVSKGNLLRAASRVDDAVAAYKKVLAADPNNIDALYNLGLALLGSSEKEQQQEAVNALADFVAKAPATDKRVPDAKSTIEMMKNQFKIEAEKPAKRGKKP